MNKIKNPAFPIIIMLTLVIAGLTYCNSNKQDKPQNRDVPMGLSDSDPTIARPDPEDSIQIDTNHLSFRTCDPIPERDLGMTAIFQQTTKWCWAACGEMVMKKLGDPTATQCDQANKSFPPKGDDCCDFFPLADTCVHGGFPEFNKYGFLFDRTDSKALNWEDVKTQIDCQNAPFCWTKKYTGGGGHIVVISGYAIGRTGENCVLYLEPWPVSNGGSARLIPYSEYVTSDDGTYSHWDDFYNIRKRE
jgi:hypothetical protein